MKALKQVNDKFSLFRDGRTIGANKRKYIIKSVQDMINSPRTKELIRLGEAFGYYGHNHRIRANKLTLSESEVINIGGKAVIVDNIPSNRTLAISCSDDGVVSHTQEFLATESGKIIAGLHKSNAGGWSWATGGDDRPDASITNSYHGMDYVLQPNFISLNHPSMMLESANSNQEQMILESLQSEGFDLESAQNILASMMKTNSPSMFNNDLESQLHYLQGLNTEISNEKVKLERQSKLMKSIMLEAAKALPFYLTEEQQNALENIETEHDQQVIQAMFESFDFNKLVNLPSAQYEASKKIDHTPKRSFELSRKIVNLTPKRRF